MGLDFLVPTLFLDEEKMIKYIRGDRLNPYGKSWTEAKRILAVISVNRMIIELLRYYSRREKSILMTPTYLSSMISIFFSSWSH